MLQALHGIPFVGLWLQTIRGNLQVTVFVRFWRAFVWEEVHTFSSAPCFFQFCVLVHVETLEGFHLLVHRFALVLDQIKA